MSERFSHQSDQTRHHHVPQPYHHQQQQDLTSVQTSSSSSSLQNHHHHHHHHHHLHHQASRIRPIGPSSVAGSSTFSCSSGASSYAVVAGEGGSAGIHHQYQQHLQGQQQGVGRIKKRRLHSEGEVKLEEREAVQQQQRHLQVSLSQRQLQQQQSQHRALSPLEGGSPLRILSFAATALDPREGRSLSSSLPRPSIPTAPGRDDNEDEDEEDVKENIAASGEDPNLGRTAATVPTTRTSPPQLLLGSVNVTGVGNVAAAPAPAAPSSSVPIFALHPRGTFYVPLSVDYSVVAPLMVLFDSSRSDSGGGGNGGAGGRGGGGGSPSPSSSSPPLMLHPITINVNFCGPVHAALAAMTASAPTTAAASTATTASAPSASIPAGAQRSAATTVATGFRRASLIADGVVAAATTASASAAATEQEERSSYQIQGRPRQHQ